MQVPGTARNMDMLSGVASQLVSKKMKAKYERQNRKVEGSWIYAKEKKRLPLASLLRERNKSVCVTHDFLGFLLHAVKCIYK